MFLTARQVQQLLLFLTVQTGSVRIRIRNYFGIVRGDLWSFFKPASAEEMAARGLNPNRLPKKQSLLQKKPAAKEKPALRKRGNTCLVQI